LTLPPRSLGSAVDANPGALDPSHPLFDLQTMGALLGPSALVVVDLPDDAAAASLGADLRRRWPDAELEQWVDGLDRPLGVAWEARGLVMADALALGALLADHSPRWCVLPCPEPAIRRARAHGRVVHEALVAEGVTALWETVPDRDLDRRDAVRRLRPRDRELRALVDELRSALREALGPGALPPGAARATLRERDGAVGLWLPLDGPTEEGHAPPRARAEAAWGAIVGVMHRRASHPAIRVVPTGRWRAHPTLQFDLELLIPPAPGLPTGDPGPWDDALDPGPRCARIAVQVRAHADVEPPPAREAAWAALVDAEDGGPTYTEDGAHAEVWLGRGLRAAPTTPGWRALPALPWGLDALATDLTVLPHRGAARWFVRWRDALRDADLIEAVTVRRSEPRDHDLVAEIVLALDAAGVDPDPQAQDRWITPIADSEGRHGLLVRLARTSPQVVSARALPPDEASYRAALDALGGPLQGVDALATVAWPPPPSAADGVRVHLWYVAEAGAAPQWAPAPADPPR
jgi:hypothetical protein